MTTVIAARVLIATFASLAFVAMPSLGAAEEKRRPQAQEKVQKGPSAAPTTRDGKGRTESVEKNETITIHRKK
ncbi:MAG: hypothetical protein AB7O88_22930 [Reyranellaceae bacterium]